MEPSIKSFEMLGQLLNLSAREPKADFGSITQNAESKGKKDSSEGGFGSLLAREKARSAVAGSSGREAPGKPAAESGRARAEEAGRPAGTGSGARGKDSPPRAADKPADPEPGKDLPPEGEQSPVADDGDRQALASAAGSGDEPVVTDSDGQGLAPTEIVQDPVQPVVDGEIVDGDILAAAGSGAPESTTVDDLPDDLTSIATGAAGDGEEPVDPEQPAAVAVGAPPVVDDLDPETDAALVTVATGEKPETAGVAPVERPATRERGAGQSAEAIALARENGPEAARQGLDQAAAVGARATTSEAVVQAPVDDPGRRATPVEIAQRGPQLAPASETTNSDTGADADTGDQQSRRDRAPLLSEQARLAARPGEPGGREFSIEVRADRTGPQSVSGTQATTGAAPTGAPSTQPAHQAARPGMAGEMLAQGRVQVGQDGWDQAIAQRIAALAARGVQAAEIRLDPPELGPIKVAIQVNADQQASVTINSHNAGVREALEMTANRLREMFAEGGLNLSNLDVSDHGFGDGAGEEAEEAGGNSRSGDGDVHESAGATETGRQTVVTSQSLVDFYV